jgi:hypothetical protein
VRRKIRRASNRHRERPVTPEVERSKMANSISASPSQSSYVIPDWRRVQGFGLDWRRADGSSIFNFGNSGDFGNLSYDPLPASFSQPPPPIAFLLQTKAQVQFDRTVTERSKPFFPVFHTLNCVSFGLPIILFLRSSSGHTSTQSECATLPFVRYNVKQKSSQSIARAHMPKE